MYSGSSDLTLIRAVKHELSIPVITNGDIRDEESAEAALDFTGCDGLMIGRAAMGNLFIFKRIWRPGKSWKLIGRYDKLEDFKIYVALLEEYNLCSSTNVRMHTHLFTKGLRGSRQIREKVNNLKDGKALIGLIKDLSQPK